MMTSSVRYPHAPSYKRGETSAQAAAQIRSRAETLREAVLDLIRHNNYTADEAANFLGEAILSIRPRLSELRQQGLIEGSGIRRRNA